MTPETKRGFPLKEVLFWAALVAGVLRMVLR